MNSDQNHSSKFAVGNMKNTFNDSSGDFKSFIKIKEGKYSVAKKFDVSMDEYSYLSS